MTDYPTLSVEDADEIVYGTHVAKQFVAEHRWYNRFLVVFQREDGGYQGFYYLDPLTELQEDGERYESEPVQTFPVEAREVTTTVYDALPSKV